MQKYKTYEELPGIFHATGKHLTLTFHKERGHLGHSIESPTSARNYSRTTYPDSYWILNDRLLSDIYDETYPVED